MNLTHTNALLDAEDLRRQTAQRAYELYEQRGRQDGFALQDWLQAKQEVAHLAENIFCEESELNPDHEFSKQNEGLLERA